MNTIFVKARKISKSLKGQRGSVVNYAKYIMRELPGVDYSEKGEILASGILGTNETPLEFWKKAEQRENQTKRKDTARFAKEYIMALPAELSQSEMLKICEEVAKKLSSGNRVVQWAMHEPDSIENNSDKNFHCHYIMSEREYVNGIFSETKNRDWNTKQFLRKHKNEIGEIINQTLERNNLSKWKIEIGEEEPIIDKSENQIRAEKANLKKIKLYEKKIELAEGKINELESRRISTGLGNTINRNPNESKQPNSNGIISNSNLSRIHANATTTDSGQSLAEQFADFQRTRQDARQAERRKGREEQELREQLKNNFSKLVESNRNTGQEPSRKLQKHSKESHDFGR